MPSKKRAPFPYFRKLGEAVERIENKETGIIGWTACFAAIVCVRDFLETWSTANYAIVYSSEKAVTDFVFYHTFLSYLFPFLGLAVIIRLFTGERVSKILNFVLVLAGMIFVAPSVDLLVGTLAGKSMPIAYDSVINVKNLADFGKYWLDFAFFWPYGLFFDGRMDAFHYRQNLGIRTEVNLILLVAASYVFWKTRDAIRTFVAYFVMNAGFMIYVSFPMFLWLAASAFPKNEGVRMFPNAVSLSFSPSNLAYLLSVIFFASVLSYWANPKKFSGIVSNFRIGRVMNVLILFSFGVFLGFSVSKEPFRWSDVFDIMAIVATAFALLFEWFAAVCHNDLEDEEGDRLSMSHRPLPTGLVTREEMTGYAWLFWAAALYVGNLIGHAVFVTVLFKAALHFLYSSKQFRLKAVPLVSNFVLSLTYLVTVLAGYLLVSPNGLAEFPNGAIAMILVTFTLATPFKDLKDVEGDRKVGVRTIPTIFGLEVGKRVVAALGFGGFCFVPVAMHAFADKLWIPSVLGWAAFAYAVMRKEYRERYVFWTYYAYAGTAALLISLT